MSVSRGGRGRAAETYDDLSVFHFEQTARMVDAGAQEENRQMPEIDLQRNDVLGLDSDEAAELVLMIVSVRAYVDDNQQVNGNFRSHIEIGMNFADAGWTGDNDLETDNLGTSGEIAGRTRLENDARLLWTGEVTYQSYAETSNTAMATWPGNGFNFNVLPFRRWFGQGPLVDDDDQLQVGVKINATGMGGTTNCVTLINCTSYWDVFQVEKSYSRVD